MKIYCYLFNLTIPQQVLNSNIDGISIVLPVSVLFGINGAFNYSYIPTLNKMIDRVRSAGKKLTLAFSWGKDCGRAIYDNFPYLELTRNHHQDSSNPDVPMKIPIPYDAGYLQKVNEIITILAIELKKNPVNYATIENIKITGINEATAELRITAADFTGTENLNTAYAQGASKWMLKGYSCQEVVDAAKYIIGVFDNAFADKNIILAYVPVLSGFPTIDYSGLICAPKKRPDLKAEIIAFGQNLSNNFKAQYTAFDLTVTVPVYTKYLQINSSKLGGGVQSLEYFTSVIEKARNDGFEYLEIFSQDIVAYPSLFK